MVTKVIREAAFEVMLLQAWRKLLENGKNIKSIPLVYWIKQV